MSPLKLSFGSLVMAVCLSGCIKDEVQIDDLNYGLTPEFGVPLAQAHISATRIIENFDENGLIVTGEDNVLSLIYRDTLPDYTANELLDLPPQEYLAVIDLEELETVSGTDFGNITISQEEIFSFNSPQGDKLDSIRFGSGDFVLSLISSGNYPVNGNLKVYGESDQLLFTVLFFDDSAPIDVSTNVDMENMLFKPINNETVTNGLKFVYELTFSDEDEGEAGEMNIDIQLSGFSIRHAGGYIAPRQYTITDQSVDINMFDQETFGQVSLADPRLRLNFQNGFGIGLGVQIERLTTVNVNGQTQIIEGSEIDNFSNIGAADFLGDVVQSSAEITNSNITPTLTEILEFSPNNISADFGLSVNPNDDQSVFVSSESELGINLEVEIPIYGSISDFQLIDTTDVSLGDFVQDAQDMSEIETLDLRIFVNNGLPLDVGVQIIFLDDNLQALDSLFLTPDFVFSSAPVNLSVPETDPSFGTSTGQTPTLTTVSISQDRVPNLETATNMIIRVFGHTANNGDHHIKILDSNFFDLHLSGKAKLSL